MKKLLLIIFVLCNCSMALAQVGELNISMDKAAQKTVTQQPTLDKKWGYTICLFADNSQYARQSAREELKKVRELLPYEPSTLQYENPFFKVYVGRCYDRSEAVRLLGVLEYAFPRAVIAVKEFSIGVFGNYRSKPIFVVDSLTTEQPIVDLQEQSSDETTSESMTDEEFVDFFNEF